MAFVAYHSGIHQKRFSVPSTILCVDDRPQVLALRKANLETRGYSVMVALSGHASMKMLEKMPMDAVLLEYRQEGMDAEAIAFHIKGHFPNLPIILLSAYSEMSERILWLVDEYVMKSAPLEELVRIIEQAMKPSFKKPVASETILTARRIASA